MDNLSIYESMRQVPKEAKKPITGGRLKGMTDINPMWRIKKLTEVYGPCGIGWYYIIKDKWIENIKDSNEVTANVEIELYVKYEDEWSKPIQGIGGSMLAANEKRGLYVNDECFKMALTDAISIACKALGMAADVYWDKDSTKYSDTKRENFDPVKKETPQQDERAEWRQKVISLAESKGISAQELAKDYKLNSGTTADRFKEVYEDLGA